MIEQALYEHLRGSDVLAPFLAKYDQKPAVFNQEAAADVDLLWGSGPQYGRIVFCVNIEGDPERTMGGTLTVDILCKKDEQYPEEIEPIVRSLIHGYFFSNGTFTMAAQFRRSDAFTEPTNQVAGVTMAFSLLAFPILTTTEPDVIERINEWTAQFDGVHVINKDELPAAAWKPADGESAVYWRLVNDNAAGWIPDTYQTIWRTANLKCHIFSQDNATAGAISRIITSRLYSDKRLLKAGESPIMTNRKNNIDFGADPMRAGQVSCEATYGIIITQTQSGTIENIKIEEA